MPGVKKKRTSVSKGSTRGNVEVSLTASNDDKKGISTPPIELSQPTSGKSSDSVDPNVAEVSKAKYGPTRELRSKINMKKLPNQPGTSGSGRSFPEKCTRKTREASTSGKKSVTNDGSGANKLKRKLTSDTVNDSAGEVSSKKKMKTCVKKLPNQPGTSGSSRSFPKKCTKKTREGSPSGKESVKNDGSDPNKMKTSITDTANDLSARMDREYFRTHRKSFLASLSVSDTTSMDNLEALDFKVNFQKKKEELCARLFKIFNREIFHNKLPADMKITWTGSGYKGTAGYCHINAKKEKRKRNGLIIPQSAYIALAPKILLRPDYLRDTLVHEMCHAAECLINGIVSREHGEVWQAWARKAMTRFPELPTIEKCHRYDLFTKFTYKCKVCGQSIGRDTKSIDLNRFRCGLCRGELEILRNKKKTGENGMLEFTTTKYVQKPPSAFNLFVKANYQRVKSMNTDKKHGELMKVLSEEYAVLKSVMTPKTKAAKSRKSEKKKGT